MSQKTFVTLFLMGSFFSFLQPASHAMEHPFGSIKNDLLLSSNHTDQQLKASHREHAIAAQKKRERLEKELEEKEMEEFKKNLTPEQQERYMEAFNRWYKAGTNPGNISVVGGQFYATPIKELLKKDSILSLRDIKKFTSCSHLLKKIAHLDIAGATFESPEILNTLKGLSRLKLLSVTFNQTGQLRLPNLEQLEIQRGSPLLIVKSMPVSKFPLLVLNLKELPRLWKLDVHLCNSPLFDLSDSHILNLSITYSTIGKIKGLETANIGHFYYRGYNAQTFAEEYKKELDLLHQKGTEISIENGH